MNKYKGGGIISTLNVCVCMCVRRVCTILRAKTVDEGLFFLVVLTGKRIG